MSVGIGFVVLEILGDYGDDMEFSIGM